MAEIEDRFEGVEETDSVDVPMKFIDDLMIAIENDMHNVTESWLGGVVKDMLDWLDSH